MNPLALFRIEKFASASIGVLLIGLSLATEIAAIIALSLHQEPDSSNVSLIVSVSALVLMVAIWLPKRYLARALNSSAMAGEATCSLSCIQITIVLFVGSLIFRLWTNGWWVDSATSLVLGALFGWEGYKMIKWVRDPSFDGGCCKECLPSGNAEELGESYRDLCDCCTEKSECKNAGECKCGVKVGEEVCLIVSCSIQTGEFMSGSPTMHVAYLATWRVLSVARIRSLRELVLNRSVPFFFFATVHRLSCLFMYSSLLSFTLM